MEKYTNKKLDIGCGNNKKDETWFGIDYRKLPLVDKVQNLEKFPWKLPSNHFEIARCMHVVEHINPCQGTFIKFMDEIWRVLREGSDLFIETPYAPSTGFFRDPTHCNPCNEETWFYFTPEHPLYNVYQPKPWKLKYLDWNDDEIKIILTKTK